ncbi:MAG: hypothetical protein QM796_18645 [Chthoniobacteraceae bacterium]
MEDFSSGWERGFHGAAGGLQLLGSGTSIAGGVLKATSGIPKLLAPVAQPASTGFVLRNRFAGEAGAVINPLAQAKIAIEDFPATLNP